jgi:hypothetical protein
VAGLVSVLVPMMVRPVAVASALPDYSYSNSTGNDALQAALPRDDGTDIRRPEVRGRSRAACQGLSSGRWSGRTGKMPCRAKKTASAFPQFGSVPGDRTDELWATILDSEKYRQFGDAAPAGAPRGGAQVRSRCVETAKRSEKRDRITGAAPSSGGSLSDAKGVARPCTERQRGLAQRSHRARQLASSAGTRSTRPHTRSITGGSR